MPRSSPGTALARIVVRTTTNGGPRADGRKPLRLALHGLTPREREVAGLLTRGASNEEIAQALWISRHTVKDHVKAVYAKLKVASRAELSAKLFQEHVAPRLDSQTIREFGPAGLAR